jgi:zinc transport system permease protein
MQILSEPFFLRALLAGVGIAVVAAPIGCFVVWRRMAYFGESLAHSGLLGVAVGLFFGINTTIGVVVTCLAVAVMLAGLQRQRVLASDTLLGILSHGSLALGLIVASVMTWVRFDLTALLFGDILTVSAGDIAWVWLGGAAALGLMAWLWRHLLAATVHEELAQAEGVPVRFVETGFMLLIAFTIAVAMKIVGILLMTALLIIPAAAARRLAVSPEAMVLFAAILGMVSVIGGLFASATWDTPSGPSIVMMSCVLFVVTTVVPAVVRLLQRA